MTRTRAVEATAVDALIDAVAQRLQERRAATPINELTPRVSWKSFQEMRPSLFTGVDGPLEAEAWLGEIDDIFKILRPSDEERCNFATFQLRNGAKEWWRSIESTEGSIEDGKWTWRTFKSKFLEKYFHLEQG